MSKKNELKQQGMKSVFDVQKALKETNKFLDSVHARLELSNKNEEKNLENQKSIIELLTKISEKN